jgi:DNA polymerase-3 subunit delta'
MSTSDKLLPWHDAPYLQLHKQLVAGRLGHAWLISGQEGVGKQLLARQFAKRLFCRQPQGSMACGSCKYCL